MVSARARVHGSNELEARREIRLPRGARDCNLTGLQRFAQYLQDLAAEFRKLIEKKHAAVSQ